MVEKICHVDNDPSLNRAYERTYKHENNHGGYIRETMPVMNVADHARFCAGCGAQIVDRYFLMTAEKHWHVQCLKCNECKLHLDNEPTCFVRDGNVYCKEDYYRRFSIKCCAKCRLGIAANEMVMRARNYVYHMTCFTCSACTKALLPGDYFGMKDSLVYCQADYEAMVPTDNNSMSPGMLHGSTVEDMSYFTGTPTKRAQKGRPRKRKLPNPETNGFSHTGMGYMTGDGDLGGPDMLGNDGYMTGSQPRQKRVRTSFKHHQLRTMKSYFGLNHNPDAKDLKQLAQKTGLSKRVLQVWFQNARAKYRRHVLKQDGDKSDRQDTSDGEVRLSEDAKTEDSKSFGDVSNNSSSSMSDVSSPSLSDIQNGLMDYDQPSNSLSDLFSNTLNTIN